MSYRVVISQVVFDAIDAQIEYLASAGAPVRRLAAWHERLFDLIESLAEMPERFPVAETVSRASGFEVRRAAHGDYAVFFRVRGRDKVVEVMAFRHGREKSKTVRGPRGDV
jgi:plasmid stabilization system protein ParE